MLLVITVWLSDLGFTIFRSLLRGGHAAANGRANRHTQGNAQTDIV